MKFDRIIWGVLLLFIGGVLLLENFDVINFYWRNVWDFWPIFLIILGVNILFNRNNSQTGNIISLGILVIALSVLFFKGQQEPTNRIWWSNGIKHSQDADEDTDGDEENDDASYSKLDFSEPYLATDGAKKTILNLSGGGTSFELKGSTDSLFFADVKKRNGNFSLTKTIADSVNTLTFRMQNKNKNWSFGSGNEVDVRLNTNPVYELNLKMGAGQIDFNLERFKVRTLNFDGGAASLELKIGDLLPIADVTVKTGVADVKIQIPTASGCRIKTKTGLSTKDFTGFTKVSEGLYETPNYKSAANKIFINFEGGISNFEVDRY